MDSGSVAEVVRLRTTLSEVSRLRLHSHSGHPPTWRSIAFLCLGRLMLIGAQVHHDTANHPREGVFPAVVGADRRTRVLAAAQAVAGEPVGERAGDGDFPFADLLAVDE